MISEDQPSIYLRHAALDNGNIQSAEPSLGELIHAARVERGFTFKALAAASGVTQGQISKLEHNQVLKANPAHLAALAVPLGLTIYRLYSAAGYKTPVDLSHLGAELEHKLSLLPPDALARLEQYLERLAGEHSATAEPVVGVDQSVNS